MVSYKALNTRRKSIFSNSRHRVRYVDGCKGGAISKSIFSNSRHRVRYVDGCKGSAIIKSQLSNSRHRVRYGVFGAVFTCWIYNYHCLVLIEQNTVNANIIRIVWCNPDGCKGSAIIKSQLSNSRHRVRYVDGCKGFARTVSIISWLSVLYALNGRKVAMWILFRYEKVIFNVFNF